MLNQVVMVGRIAREPELKETENGKKVANVTIAVPRSYKNAEGVYETDFINTTLWTSIAENTCEYCKMGDMVGIKGHLQVRMHEDKEGKKRNELEVVAERVTFLAQAKDRNEIDKNKEEKEI